jgi:hypothetical protein
MPEARNSADTQLRDHLIANAVDFREMYGRKDIGKTADGRTAWDILSGKVDALLEGKAITFHRFELPDWHPESTLYGGRPDDSFTLGPDDILRPEEPSAPK